MEKATLRNYSGLDGCGWVIELSSGILLEPINLDDFQGEYSMEDGAPIWINYENYNSASICMIGQTVQVIAIRNR